VRDADELANPAARDAQPGHTPPAIPSRK
jgi:hypothetical protein